MSNLGYLRGIDGRLLSHCMYVHRHFYCSPEVQKNALGQLLQLIETDDPDICCFVEIDQGSSDSANFNQLEAILSDKYPFFDIENKYAPNSKLRLLPRTRGKSNAFIAKHSWPFEKIYFRHGTKRLVYKIRIDERLTLFFAHFSLKKIVRHKQLLEIRELIGQTPGDVILLGDFNILTGMAELSPLLANSDLRLLNDDSPTFTFHRFQRVLDLCIFSESLAGKVELRIIPQPFSDHAALLVHLNS